MTTLKRNKLYDRQNGQCYYCESPMWILRSKVQPVESTIRAFMRKHGVKHHCARQLECTIEHLVCKRYGGTDAMTNIVAACKRCNSCRSGFSDDTDHTVYKPLVIRKMKRGIWFKYFNPLHVFDYEYSPSYIDVIMGKIIRQFILNKKWISRLQRNYRGYRPQQMTKMQMAQSFIRARILTFS